MSESYYQSLTNIRNCWHDAIANSPVHDPLQDGKSKLQLIDLMGRDLSVVNDARASFGKESVGLTARDEKLIGYLASATPQHSSPFRGCVLKFKVGAPLFLSAQWQKHIIASATIDSQHQHNQQSFRYSEITEPEFYLPKVFRSQSADNRQASGDDLPESPQLSSLFANVYSDCLEAYYTAIEAGVAREQARMLLPPAIYTTWTWTVSLQALLHFIKLREGVGAQTEIQAYAMVLGEIVSELFPVVWGSWN